MKFRTRLVLTLSAAMTVMVAAAFGAASYVVERSEEHQLDEALRSEADLEAAEIGAQQSDTIHVNNRGAPEADDFGRLKKFAVIYSQDGLVIDKSLTFEKGAPPFDFVTHMPGSTFDFWYGDEHLRGVFTPIPASRSRSLLLLAAPRSDLEKDNNFLRQVMLIAALLSIALTGLVTWRVVRRLTRGHEAIAQVAHRVAAGDLSARISLAVGDDEVVQLAHDVDEMVRRLQVLVESQRRFVAHAAHELRSPLTSVYGELQLALRRPRTVDEYRNAVEEALGSARHLKILAEDLLALARIGAEERAPKAHTHVLLDDVAHSAAMWVSHEVEHRHLRLEIDADHSVVLGHAVDLERLVRNLLDNAVRHSPEGGRVRIEARSEGNIVHLFVVDDGPGVSLEERDRIFDPFFRAAADRAREDGSGLGLAIVREIAHVHGGDIHVEDGPDGKGARFHARLPAAPLI